MFNVGCLDYVDNLWEFAPAKYGIIGGAIVVLLVVIIVVMACLCYKKNAPSTNPSDQGVTNMIQDPNYDNLEEEENYDSVEEEKGKSSEPKHTRYTPIQREHTGDDIYDTIDNPKHYMNTGIENDNVPTEISESHYAKPSAAPASPQEGATSYTVLGSAPMIHYAHHDNVNFQI